MAAVERQLTDGPDAAPAPPAAWVRRLAERREAYNAVLARARASGTDPEQLRAAVTDLGSVVQELADAGAVGHAGLGPACDALLETAVGLATTRRWCPGGVERRAVLELAPALRPHLLVAPQQVLDVVVHGAHQVARQGDVAGWQRRTAAGARALPVGDVAALRALGVVAAWRSGVVRARAAALAAAPELSRGAVRAALDLDPALDVPAVLGQHARQPWWWPETAPSGPGLRVVARLGGFRGFGGPWARLPVVVGGDGVRWHVRCPVADRGGGGAEDWLVHADVHGSAVRRWRPSAALPREPVAVAGRHLRVAGVTGTAPWDDAVTGSACAGSVAVLSRARSYCLDVVVAQR